MASSSTPISDTQLELVSTLGFNGAVPSGILLHPGDKHIIFPLGSTIVVRHLIENTQHFLSGHDNAVSCLAISSTGKYLASGQTTHMGFTATVIVWNLETYEQVHKFQLHKGKVQDLAFSPGEKYLATLGGRDDNKLIIWDLNSGEAICGSSAYNDQALCVRFFNNHDEQLVTGGYFHVRVWSLDLHNRKIRPQEAQLGQLKRVVTSMSIDEDDTHVYCATQTGDLLKVSLGQNCLFKIAGPKKLFQLGLTAVLRTRDGNYVVGSGDGTVALIDKDNMTVVRKIQVGGGVTSLCLNAAGDHFFVGTDRCNLYLVALDNFEHELRQTCHYSSINQIVFPNRYSEVFATCGAGEIRVWSLQQRSELLRICVSGVECSCVCFMPDGKSIVSGWSDGKIRAFSPQSGTLLYTIHDAHVGGVTAIAAFQDSRHLVSGGLQGHVRVWAIERQHQTMLASMKEHKSRVNSICLSADNQECVSASADGSCIVWDLLRFVRVQAFFASTQFRSAEYHPDQSQILTTGTDRKLSYWDRVDGSPIRILDGSQTAALHTLAISRCPEDPEKDGEFFVSGGGDKLVKLWGYDDCFCYFKGIGHSGEILSVAISPDQRYIVTADTEGAIFVWKTPAKFLHTKVDNSASIKLSSQSRSASRNQAPLYAAPANKARSSYEETKEQPKSLSSSSSFARPSSKSQLSQQTVQQIPAASSSFSRSSSSAARRTGAQIISGSTQSRPISQQKTAQVQRLTL